MAQGNAYNPKRKRVLTEDGSFRPARIDKEQIRKELEKKGMTLEEFERQREERRKQLRMQSAGQGYHQPQQVLVMKEADLANLSEEQLRAELEKRGGGKKPTPEQPKPQAPAKDEEPVAPQEGDMPSAKEMEEMEVKELKAMAEERGIPFKKNAGKAKMIELLTNDGMPTDDDTGEEGDDDQDV